MKWNDLEKLNCIRLYAGDVPSIKEYNGLIGLSLTQDDERHIKHNIIEPFPLPDSSIDSFQAEDVFEHIEYHNLVLIINEIHRILKPDGWFRLSMPDYKCDVLYDRSIKENGKIVFDQGGGGSRQNPGHKWFPEYKSVEDLLIDSVFDNWIFLHYYNMSGKPVMKKIDYSILGYISRTPDNDERVQNPKRPMSIVVDLWKDD